MTNPPTDEELDQVISRAVEEVLDAPPNTKPKRVLRAICEFGERRGIERARLMREFFEEFSDELFGLIEERRMRRSNNIAELRVWSRVQTELREALNALRDAPVGELGRYLYCRTCNRCEGKPFAAGDLCPAHCGGRLVDLNDDAEIEPSTKHGIDELRELIAVPTEHGETLALYLELVPDERAKLHAMLSNLEPVKTRMGDEPPANPEAAGEGPAFLARWRMTLRETLPGIPVWLSVGPEELPELLAWLDRPAPAAKCERCGGSGRVTRERIGHGVAYSHICDGCEGFGVPFPAPAAPCVCCGGRGEIYGGDLSRLGSGKMIPCPGCAAPAAKEAGEREEQLAAALRNAYSYWWNEDSGTVWQAEAERLLGMKSAQPSRGELEEERDRLRARVGENAAIVSAAERYIDYCLGGATEPSGEWHRALVEAVKAKRAAKG